MRDVPRSHIAAITRVNQPERRECEQRLNIGSQSVYLRTCQWCGNMHCCDDSPNPRATKHARASGHPVLALAEPSESWDYCYLDDAFAEY